MAEALNLVRTKTPAEIRQWHSGFFVVTDEDIVRCNAVKQWFQANGIAVTRFGWLLSESESSGNAKYTPNLGDADETWYEIEGM